MSLLGGYAAPIQVKLAGHAVEAPGRIQGEVDGVEFDVRDRVQQRGKPARRKR
jgi:hypothetical protein